MSFRPGLGFRLWGGLFLGVGGAMVSAWMGCTLTVTPPATNENANANDNASEFDNSTDATNKGAEYVGSSACQQCHASIAAQHDVHGHGHKLTAVQGEPPTFPEEGTRAGVPNPPDGFAWADISYVIGGYTKKGRFIDNNGYILTTGLTGVSTQWNLDYPANGTVAGFVGYEPDAEAEKPYGYSCFYCHVTGAKTQDEDFPEFQENRPGFIGTWEEPGVQCEACHGPGGKHFQTVEGEVLIDTTAIYVSSTGVDTCGKCHTRGDDPNVIIAKGGFIQHHEQYPELMASGGHSSLTCTTCHSPHVSAVYDRDNAIRNACTDCHADQNMGKHEGKVFVRGDYTETLSCESCHMPFVTKSGSSATAEVVGDVGRMGDTRTHIFRIDSSSTSYTTMFNEDQTAVAKDAENRAAVTLDFVCYRCHNGIGTFSIEPEFITDIAANIHATSGS